MTVQIPVAMLMEIDPELLPPGPKGDPGPAGGKIIDFVSAVPVTGFPAKSDSTFSAVISASITPKSPTSKILLCAKINLGLTALNITRFKVFRDELDLTPSGVDAHLVMRPSNADAVHPGAIDWLDEPACTDPITYSLLWSVNQSVSWLGRRGADLAIKTVGATLTLTEIA